MTITGAQVRQERNRRKLTQQDLAVATGVSVTTIGRIERGDVSDSPNVQVLAAHLGLGPAPEAAPGEPDLTNTSVYSLLDELARRALVADQILRDARVKSGPAPADLDSNPEYTLYGPRHDPGPGDRPT